MPDKEEVQKAFETITKKATEIDKRLNTTIGATKQRSLIKESLDQEIIFGLAGVTLTVDGTARVDLLNKHTFKADDKTKQDPDGILGTKPEEDVDDMLWPQIPFRPDQTWLKYKLKTEAEATGDRTFFDASASGAVTLGWYRGHAPKQKVGTALLKDLSQPRFALVEGDVSDLKPDEALTLQVRGKLSAKFSFEWSDFFTSNLSVFGEMLDEDETFSIKTEVGATASVTAAIGDDFILVFTWASAERLRVAVKKANEKSLNVKAGVSAKVGFTNSEDVAKVIKSAKDGLIGPHVTQITDILGKVTKFDDLSQEQKALVDQVRKRLRVVDDTLDKLEGLRKTIAGLDVRLDKEITTWAEAKLEFGFTFEYYRVKTQLAIVQATFPTARLGDFHGALIRHDLATLLGQVSETPDGVTIEKFLNQTSLKIERSFGFSLGLGTWSAGETTFSVTEETDRKNIEGHTQASFSCESGYKGHWGSDEWTWQVGFTANMANFSSAIEPRASEFDYSIDLLAEFVEGTVSADHVGRFVDQAVLWGAINPAGTAAQTQRLATLIVGKKKVKFSYSLNFEQEVISEILDELAGDNGALFARALGAAMPWSEDFITQRNQGLRAREYGRLWRWYLADQSRNPRQLARVAEQQLKKIDPELAVQEGRQWETRTTTTIAGIAKLNRTRADWKRFVKGVRDLHTATESKGDLDDIRRAYGDMKRLWGQGLHIRAFGAFLLCMAIRHSDTWDGAERGDTKREGGERDTVERVFTVTYEDDTGTEQTESISAAVPALQWCGDDGAVS